MTSTRLVEWFEKEAGGYLTVLERDADGLGKEPLALDGLRAAARALAGAARLAGRHRLHRAAAALEAGLRTTDLEPGNAADRLAEDVRLSVADLRFLLDTHGPTDARDARVDVVAARWSDAASIDDGPAATTGHDDFTGFVVREAEGVADAMDAGIDAFSRDPSSREWLGSILRRQRALLGSARLDEITVLAEALRAVEDLCELIVRLGVPVKSEWLDVFRCARDVLNSAATAIADGKEPGQTPALSRLRTLREELVARYGDRVASQTVETAARAAAVESESPADPRQRAAVLRARIAQVLGSDSETREALDELYGLLMSALR